MSDAFPDKSQTLPPAPDKEKSTGAGSDATQTTPTESAPSATPAGSEKSEKIDLSFLDSMPFITEYTAIAGKPLPAGEKPAIRKDIIPYFGQVVDPEIGMDVMELGLVYALDVDEKGNVSGEMTVTAPGCLFADSMLQEAADSLAMAKGVGEVKIKLVWDPPWDFAMISDQAKLDLDLM